MSEKPPQIPPPQYVGSVGTSARSYTPMTARELVGWFTPEFLRHQDREDLVRAGALLAARLEAALALHELVHRRFTRRTSGEVCRQCNRNWPCPTRRKLDGEDA